MMNRKWTAVLMFFSLMAVVNAYETRKALVDKTDSVTGLKHPVLTEVKLTAKTTQKLDMMYSTVLPYSFITERTAKAIKAPVVGEINLREKDPQALDHLTLIYGMNPTKQTTFKIVRISKFDLGVGPIGGKADLLVLDDKNSEFGIIGRNFSFKFEKGKTYVHSAVDNTLYYMKLPKLEDKAPK